MKAIVLAGAFGAASAMLLAPAASAQIYAGGGYSSFHVADLNGDYMTFGAATAQVGYAFNKHFSLEAEAGFGVKDDDAPYFASTEAKLRYHVGGYAVGRFPLFGPVTLYGRVGYTETKVDTVVAPVSDGRGHAFGGGLEIDLTDNLAGRLDYTRHTREKEVDTETIGASVAMKF